MQIRYARIIGTAIALEALIIAHYLALFTLFFDFGVNHIPFVLSSGIIFCLLAGWWVAKGLKSSHQLNGAILGAVTVVIEVAFILSRVDIFQMEYNFKRLILPFTVYFVRVVICMLGGVSAAPIMTAQGPEGTGQNSKREETHDNAASAPDEKQG